MGILITKRHRGNMKKIWRFVVDTFSLLWNALIALMILYAAFFYVTGTATIIILIIIIILLL